MKNLFRISGVILLATSVLTSCKKDTSTTDTRDAFVATYSVSETWTENSNTLTKPAFTMSVEKATQHANMLLLNNFGNYGAGITAEALVSGDSISIPQQTLSNSKAIRGSGFLTDTTLTFVYTESYYSVSIAVTATANKL